MKITLGDTTVLLLHSGIALLPDSATAVVSDMHLEKGSSYAKRGFYLPPYDSRATLEKLLDTCTYSRVRRIIFLGDSFHDAQGHERLMTPARKALAALSHYDCIWVKGNHDGDYVPNGFIDCMAHEQDGIVFRHEASPDETRPEISGHFHPKAPIRHKGGRIEKTCFLEDGRKMIMPAFGAYTGGLSVADPALRRHMGQVFRAHVLGRTRIYSFSSGNLDGN